MTTTAIPAGFEGWCLKCGPGIDDDLRPITCVVRKVRDREAGRLAVRPCDAAVIVRDELRKIGKGLELFALRLGQEYAMQIDAGWVARKPQRGRPAGEVTVPARGGFVATWHGESPHKVVRRYDHGCAELEGLYGPQGCIELAFATWCDESERNPEAKLTPAGFIWSGLAIRASLADRLFTHIEPEPALPAAVPAHDRLRWGHNVTSEGCPVMLRRVAGAIAGACVTGAVAAQGLPLRDAARWVIDGLADAQGLRWFMLNRAGWPKLVTDADVWMDELPAGSDILRASGLVLIGDQWKPDPDRVPVSFADWPNEGPFTLTRAELIERDALHLVEDDGRAESFVFDAAGMARVPGRPACRGVAGLVELLRRQWCERIEGPEDLDAGELAAVAVPAAALAALPWMTSRTDNAGSLAGVCDDGVIEPEGGAWPHKQGESWNEAERVAMFRMRHRSKLTGERIAEIVGVSRQTIDEIIGPARAPSTGNWGKCDWRPSAVLLEACGLSKTAAQRGAAAPLQMVARELTGT